MLTTVIKGCVANRYNDRVIPLPCRTGRRGWHNFFGLYTVSESIIVRRTYMPTALIADHALNCTYSRVSNSPAATGQKTKAEVAPRRGEHAGGLHSKKTPSVDDCEAFLEQNTTDLYIRWEK